MNDKIKNYFILFVGIVLGLGIMFFFKTYKIEKRTEQITQKVGNTFEYPKKKVENKQENYKDNNSENKDITALTQEDVVVDYVKENHELPNYYIKKSEARSRGWVPAQGNLCEAVPGKAIGGDKFSNREGQLPKGVQYFEADLNYICGRRQTDRMVYTKSGDVWVTHDHYKTFEKK